MTIERQVTKIPVAEAPEDHPPPQVLPLLAVLHEEFAELHPSTPGAAASETPADLCRL